MRLSQVVRSGPGQYLCQTGALGFLAPKLQHFQQPCIIAGEKSLAAFKRAMPETTATAAAGADVLIGIGGGRALDTAKGTAELLNVEYITLPTVLGTCAATTPLSAVYWPDHAFRSVDYYHRSAYLTLVDLALLITSPRDYFLGGIGDTLAKWYEAEAITRHQPAETLPVMVRMGLAAARECRDVLLRDTPAALDSMTAGEVSPAFQRVVEAILAVAGMVGGCAGESGRMAGAHAIHNAMSHLPETHSVLHGMKVAYGILVQLVATGDEQEVVRLLPFYRHNGFPYNFATLGITTPAEEAIGLLAHYAAREQETFRLALPGVTEEQIAAALRRVEQLACDAYSLSGAGR